MKKKENTIEFWAQGKSLDAALKANKPDSPIDGPASVNIILAQYCDCELPRPVIMEGDNLVTLTATTLNGLVDHGFINDINQVFLLAIKKLEGRMPGIAFVMEEMEEP